MTNEDILKKKIERLEKEIEELEKRRYATHKNGTVTNYEYNSDVGEKTPFGEKNVSVRMSDDEIKASRRSWELELYSLKSELQQAREELWELEWNRPENVERRQREALIKKREEEEQQLQKERLEHEERYDDLNKLVEYLRKAGLGDVANRLSELRFAFQKPKSDYIRKEIDLQFRTKTQTTKKEYSEIKRNVIRLSKEATRNAKRYKDLYNLYLHARKIVRDIEEKGISQMQGDRLIHALENYFTQPTGKYLFRDSGSYYSYKESENLGYQYLGFYRDYHSKYNEDVRKGRI